MKVLFGVDNGANIHSKRTAVYDVEKLGYTPEEWKELSDEEKWEEAKNWAHSHIGIWYEELED